MMYTVVPSHLLEQQPSLPPRRLQPIRGGYAELWQDGSVCRLISTDPTLYLDPHFAPGANWQSYSNRSGGM
ncbi:MAG: hypothetical protein IKU72_04865 [Oscillospiraceae bacterium]|nr:hypothetical protein [Oscillospiraceae bacterium]